MTVVFFFLGAAPGFWAPSVSNMLRQNGLEDFVPWAFVPHGVAALVSPLIFGALADQRIRADRLLMVTCALSAVSLWLAFRAIVWDWGVEWFVVFLVLNAVIAAPMWSLMATIAMRPMTDPGKQFPLVRIGGTLGWITAGLVTGSWLKLEGTPRIGDWACGMKLMVAGLCFMLPATEPVVKEGLRTWKDRLGLGALSLLRERDQLVFFITTALLSVPMAAFYMYTPLHLADLGDEGPSATMAWSQLLEVVALIALAYSASRFRVKWIFSLALGLAVLRYGIFAISGSVPGIVSGLLLHGMIYTFFYVTGQVFMERRVEAGMRAQAQALLSVMSSGVGSLCGYTLCYFLYERFGKAGDWTSFWWVLTGICGAALVLFVGCYRSEGASKA